MQLRNGNEMRKRKKVENIWADEEDVIYVSDSEGIEDDKVLYEVEGCNKKVSYFIRVGTFGPIKIGNSTDPRKRLIGMQTGCPDTLVLLGITFDEEDDLFVRFREERRRGEWFEPSNRLLSYIKEHRLHESDI